NLVESLAGGFTFNGTQCAVPTAASFWVTFYNKKVFADNNLTVPTTWAEYTNVCETLKAAGVTPLGASQVGRWPAFIIFQDMVLHTDPVFYNDLMAGKAKYTDDTCKQAMTTWKTMIDAGYYTSFDSDLFADVPGQFQSGDVAMLPIGTWYQSTFTGLDMVPGTDYDIFLTPNITDGLTAKSVIVETGALAIAKNSGKIDDAKKMANFWISPDTNTFFANKLGDTPFNPKSTSENVANAGLLKTVADESYTLYQRYWEASPVPIVEGAVDFLAEFMLDTSKLDDVLQKIQNLADTEWAKRESDATPTT
ncbi:MAG TPA: extracellular solute-binding protein, partial [Thermomicrobiales bacterium]|nr:extracellular solute-binding protein [Thermomicrobiales bacterium]